MLESDDVRLIEILLVEDNPGDVRLAMEAFRDGKLANRLRVVGDGDEALALMRREGTHQGAPRPDLVLLDLNLPRVSGQEVLALLRADPELTKIPVVVLTASQEEHDVLRALHLGATAYMTKPVDAAQLMRVVEEVHLFRVGILAPNFA
jgi:two-component system, chemotaxis family, response regulator Rcp1